MQTTTTPAPAVVLACPNPHVQHLRVCADTPEAARELLREHRGAEVWIKLPEGHTGPDAVIDKTSIRLLGPAPAAAQVQPPAPGFRYLTTMHDRRVRLYYKNAAAPADAQYLLRWANVNGHPGDCAPPLTPAMLDEEGRVAA